MDQQRRLIDFVPRHLSGIGVLVLGGLGIVAGLIGLHVWSIPIGAKLPQGTLAVFDLAKPGNLAQWFSGLLLIGASVTALLVFSLRRHRTDDYQGCYRVWLAAALAWFFLAADVSTGFHRGLQQLLVHLTGAPLWKEGVLWWVVPYLLVFGSLGSRLVVDMWPCRLSLTALAFSLGGYSVSLALGFGWWPSDFPGDPLMIRVGAAMIGHLMLAVAMVAQARFVILDIEGLLPPRKPNGGKKRRCREDEEGEEEPSRWRRIDSSQGTPQPVLRRMEVETAPEFTPVDEDSDSDDDDDLPNPTGRKLTKQEKKALKERLQRERAAREKKQNKW